MAYNYNLSAERQRNTIKRVSGAYRDSNGAYRFKNSYTPYEQQTPQNVDVPPALTPSQRSKINIDLTRSHYKPAPRPKKHTISFPMSEPVNSGRISFSNEDGPIAAWLIALIRHISGVFKSKRSGMTIYN